MHKRIWGLVLLGGMGLWAGCGSDDTGSTGPGNGSPDATANGEAGSGQDGSLADSHATADSDASDATMHASDTGIASDAQSGLDAFHAEADAAISDGGADGASVGVDSGAKPPTDGGPFGDSGGGDATLADGAAPDASTVDSGALADAANHGGSDAGQGDAASEPGACGAGFCRGSQTCVSGSCVYTGCTGVQVPGDYATITGAVAALASAGGTICLDGSSYPETVSVGTVGTQVNGPLTIQGASADAVTVAGLAIRGATHPLVLKGMTVTQQSFVSSAQSQTLAFEGCAFPGGLSAAAQAGALSLTASTVETIFSAVGNVTVDQSLIYEGINYGGTCGAASTSPPIVVRNSYVNGSFAGGVIETDAPECPPSDTWPTVNVVLLNDTFVANLDAIIAPANSSTVGIFGINNIFVGDTDGGTAIPVPTQISNDLVFAYSAHYGPGESPQPNTIFADPQFDTATPPGLLAGSPALGAGVASYTPPALGVELDAPTVDYWGRPRDPDQIDLGAVQVSP
jgi:hypothetical protein